MEEDERKMMRLDIQLFGGRGSSSSNADTEPKSATFTTATRTYDDDGNPQRQDIEVKGVSFRYKTIDVGVFNAEQEAYASTGARVIGRGTDKYVAVVRTNNETNGVMLTTGKTRKEAVANAKKTIDERKKQILKAIGR